MDGYASEISNLNFMFLWLTFVYGVLDWDTVSWNQNHFEKVNMTYLGAYFFT